MRNLALSRFENLDKASAVENNNGKTNVQILFQDDKFCSYFEPLKISTTTIAPIVATSFFVAGGAKRKP
jgi:hypothetical protein